MLVLPPDDEEAWPKRPEELLDVLDGLILAGGSDIDPASYGAEREPETGTTWPERDAFELALTRAALDRGMPLLGICRGMQLLNVALGGTLHSTYPPNSATATTCTPPAPSATTTCGSNPARSPPARRGPSTSPSSPTTTRGSTGSARGCGRERLGTTARSRRSSCRTPFTRSGSSGTRRRTGTAA